MHSFFIGKQTFINLSLSKALVSFLTLIQPFLPFAWYLRWRLPVTKQYPCMDWNPSNKSFLEFKKAHIVLRRQFTEYVLTNVVDTFSVVVLKLRPISVADEASILFARYRRGGEEYPDGLIKTSSDGGIIP